MPRPRTGNPTGRPKGSGKVKAKSELIEAVGTILTKRTVDQEKLTPLDVMLNTMDLWYKEAEHHRLGAEGERTLVRKRARLHEMHNALTRASALADKIAPFMHPKLTSTTLSGDKDKDAIQIDVQSLSHLSPADLAALETLLTKVTGT